MYILKLTSVWKITCINLFKIRSGISQLRITAHNLNIENLRYGRDRKERFQRICTLCNSGEIEDEYHFLLKCSKYDDLRSQFIKKYYFRRPSMEKVVQLLSVKNKSTSLKLGKFIQQAFKRRTSLQES